MQRRTDSGNENRSGGGSSHPTTTQIVVGTSKLVALKGGIGVESSEFLILDGYVSSLTKFKDRLDYNCKDL